MIIVIVIIGNTSELLFLFSLKLLFRYYVGPKILIITSNTYFIGLTGIYW